MIQHRGIVMSGAIKVASYLGNQMEEEEDSYKILSAVDETSGRHCKSVRLPKSLTILEELEIEEEEEK